MSQARGEHAVGSSSAVPGHRPLDILIVTSEAPPIVSGISTCIDRLATGLVARDHNVRVLSSAQIRRIVAGEIRLSSFITHWPRIARGMRHLDVVNVHGPVPTMSDVFLWLSKRLPSHSRPAIVYTYHSPIDIQGALGISTLYNKMHERLALRADRIVASSQHYARQHRSRYGPRVQTIPWGADRRGSARPRVRPTPGQLRALFVGQMRPYKGIETLLSAAAGQPWLKLTLVGHGAGAANYQKLAHRLNVTNAQFLGHVTHAELNEQYASNDVVILPSVTRAEAFGLVLVEGMSAGCVPVASDLPGVRDVAGPTGLVVPPRDPEALRAALRGLARDTAQLERLSAASRIAAETYTWERCVASYERVMLDAVCSRYARLHGLPMLPELDEPERLRVINTPDADPRSVLPAPLPTPRQAVTVPEMPVIVAGDPVEA